LSDPFVVKDCTLITMVENIPPVFDLRDLRERLTACSEESLYHHFCQTLLRPTFDDPEYHNDLARWARFSLQDKTLAERLAVLNPFELPSMETFRETLLDVVEERISELPHISNVQTGDEFRFLKALTLTFDAGISFGSAREMLGAFRRLTPSSIFYHYIEARRRNPGPVDDFTLWLRKHRLRDGPTLERLSDIDFYFLSLKELQNELAAIGDDLLACGVMEWNVV